MIGHATIPSWMKNTMNLNSKIIGGQEADEPIPWQVQVRNSDGFLFCGGTIIDEYTILSAAHCCIAAELNDYIVAGALFSEPGPGTQTVSIKSVKNHPDFDENTLDGYPYDFDYSIVKLASKLTLNAYVKPACLPTKDFVPGPIATVSGWGGTTDSKFVLISQHCFMILLEIL